MKELEKKVKELQKKIEKDQKDAKQEVKNEQKQEKQLGKKVKESVKSLIDQPTQKLSSGTGIIAGRKQFSDEEKKSFQSEAFRESLLFYEGGAETLEEAKAQGLF